MADRAADRIVTAAEREQFAAILDSVRVIDCAAWAGKHAADSSPHGAR
jgi:hypothetical protein